MDMKDYQLEALAAAADSTLVELKRTHARLGQIDEQLERYRQLTTERASLATLVAQLSAEYEGLQLALRRRQPDTIDPERQTDVDWRQLSRPQAVYRILAEAGKPMSPSDIRKTLAARGRPDDPARGVSVALMRLRKRGQVRQVIRGLWAVGPDTELTLASHGEGVGDEEAE